MRSRQKLQKNIPCAGLNYCAQKAHEMSLTVSSCGHEPTTYAIANSESTTPRSLVPQGFKNSVPKTRSQEVSRKTRFKSEKTGKTGDFVLSEVRRYIRKTPQTLACSGVFVTVLDRVAPFYWRASRYANTNCLCFLMYALCIPAKTHLGGYCICSNESLAVRSKNSFQPFAIQQIKQLERRTTA